MPSLDDQVETLRRIVNHHARLLHELHVEDLSKDQKDGFPKVLESWVQARSLATSSRRRMNMVVGISASLTALLVFIAETVVRYLLPLPVGK